MFKFKLNGKKPKKRKYLYHATFPTRVESIQKQGILFNDSGFIFMSTDIKGIQEFTHGAMNRWATEVKLADENTTDPKFKLAGVEVIYHDKVAVFKIDADKLDWKYMNYGNDHNPNFYKSTVYMYGGGIIPPEALEEVIYIPFK